MLLTKSGIKPVRIFKRESLSYLIQLTVLQQCALKPDIARFEAGDMSEVGEKGLTLR